MAFIIDTINGSGLYAQSAASASVATYDSNGNVITATYLTGVDLSNYYTKSETSGATELADAFSNIPAGDAEVNSYVQTNSGTIDETVSTYETNSGTYLTAHQAISANEWNETYETVKTNSASWGQGGGGSIDTIPFIVQSPLTTGISGYSAYIGLDGEAFESSAYVPFSALTDNDMYDGRVHLINGSGLYASDASNSNYAVYAYYDSNGNDLATTRYYAEEAYNTVQSNSANWGGGGSTPVSGLELSAGDYITIVDDIPNSASIISVTGLATTGDLNYVSGVVGDVESLLAQL